MGAAQAHAWTSTCFEVNVRIWLLYWWTIIIIKWEKKGGGYFQQVWSQLQLAKSFSVYHSLYINLQRFDMLKPRSYGNSNRPNSTGQLFCYYKTTFLGRDSHKSKFNSLNSNIRDVNSKFQLNSVSQEAPPPPFPVVDTSFNKKCTPGALFPFICAFYATHCTLWRVDGLFCHLAANLSVIINEMLLHLFYAAETSANRTEKWLFLLELFKNN